MNQPAQRRRRRKKRLPEDPVEVTIESLSDEGRGIAHVDDRAVFIDQALEGERVAFKYTRLTSKIAEGRACEVLEASADRVEPKCSVFHLCGGCSLQHMQSDAQIRMKQGTLLKHLEHIGQVTPQHVIAPLTGPVWGYRGKARLGVRYVAKKEKALVGFRERGSSFITDTERCEILHPAVGGIIQALSECVSGLEANRQIPQIEVAVGDDQTVLVFRHLVELSSHDREQLTVFAKQHGLSIVLQAGSPDELEPLWPETIAPLFYVLDEFDIRIEFQPNDFTQVNSEINQNMVRRALDFLQLENDDDVLDLFSGLGNFTLPISRYCGHVTGVEGSLAMVNKARANAELNNITNAEFHYADLYSAEVKDTQWVKRQYNKILLDPPRSGAAGILDYIKKMKTERIVYVSCHPATLARDAGVLVNELGYKLTHAGVMDMFPHTAHVESIAVFER
jgi:23S rRNA (uracil1939-C5)-methyltransferase